MGLDKDDTIVRRRMRQKLEFLTSDASAVVAPTDQDLQSWLDRNPDKFHVEPAVAFSQIYFKPDRQGEPASTAASKALAQLNRTGQRSPIAELGDATMLPRDMALSSASEVARVFGDDFARQVAQLEPGLWIGPVQSGYGWHLVHVSKRTEGGSRPLAEVREAVQREWYGARSKDIVDSTYGKLRGKYSIVIEDAQLKAAAKSRPGALANAAQRP
jgi:parvulin-like peptidyl-prolyl isomerase